MEGSGQVVSVAVTGAHGVVGTGEEKQLVSKKVSYKVDIDCSLNTFLIIVIAYAAIGYLISSLAISNVSGDSS